MATPASLALSALGGGATHLSALLSSGGVNIDFDLTFIAQMVVFAALILVMKPLLYDPMLRLFEEREKRTEGARGDARGMQEKAGELLRQYERELERVNRVAAEERDKARAQTVKLEAEILQEARAMAAKIVDDGRRTIEEEAVAIKFDLGRESERLARDIATRVLGREVR